MKTHYFINNWDLALGNFEIRDRESVHQIYQVLKLKPGETIILGDGDGLVFDAEIISLDTKSIQTNILRASDKVVEPRRPVVLYGALLKKENFEVVAQKATEIGIKEIVPIITERTVKTAINFDRLSKIAKEAAEQAGRAVVPEILEPISFKEALDDLKDKNVNYFCHFGGEPMPTAVKGERANLFVGPEGGWTDTEVVLARERELKIVSLGKTALRAETAAIVASHLAVNLLDN